jgi:hypothetical protein
MVINSQVHAPGSIKAGLKPKTSESGVYGEKCLSRINQNAGFCLLNFLRFSYLFSGKLTK